MSDWKNAHANEANKAVDHPLVQKVIDEQLENLGYTRDSLASYGLHKIAMYTAQVARAQAQGWDPDLLRLTPEEGRSELLRKAAEMVLGGVPVFTVDLADGEGTE